jgi:CHAT domain-containing protein
VEPESYLDVAVTSWLPHRWENANSEAALHALAALFEDRHHDRWLRDLLASPRSEELVRGQAALAEAVKANLADESDLALRKSAEAANGLRSEGNRAGVLRAEFEQIYAIHRSVESAAECVEKAEALEREAKAVQYSWILGQSILEQGNCRAQLGDSGLAHRDMTRALALARSAGYHDLELRSAGILTNVQTAAGNLLAAWNLGREWLSKYWSGSFAGNRAQQIYFNLVRSAESLELPRTAYVFERAAAAAITETPRRRMEATARAHLAELAVEVGLRGEARAEFERAGRLFDQLQQPSDRRYRILVELSLAQAELAEGAPAAAGRRLEALRPAADRVDATPVRIRFHQVLGDSLALTGKPDAAEAGYRRAIDLSEHQLDTLQGFRARAQLMLVASKAYRGLIELLWNRGDQPAALRLWEWFRAGEGPTFQRRPDMDQRRTQLRNESFLTYVILPSGPVAWLFDDRGIEGRRLNVKADELETVASRFLRECAEPGSDRRALQRDARQLYDWLVAPLANHLDPSRTLVIEPDGAVGAIPIQALMDENLRYLGERFAIAIAGGLADYQVRAAVGPVNAALKALVIASPTLGDEATKTFPPLVGTTREGRSIAKRFHSRLLIGGQATLSAVEQYRPAAELFHFAGHGFSNGGNGGLLLSPDQSDPDEAGVLDGARMGQQDWSRCRLAVLSACSTGTGEDKGPVNPESLVRGLLWAGVARVVACRWNVDTESGVQFMDQFYNELLSGKDASAALQLAARRLREDQATSHPYFWAGFQSFGTR